MAGCVMLNSESSIFYALAITSFLFLVQTRMCGRAVVLVSYPSRGPMRFWSVSVFFFLSLFSFPHVLASFNRG